RRSSVLAAVDGAALVPPVPRAADPRLALKAVDGETMLAEVLHRGQAAGAGADDADRLSPVIHRALVALQGGRRTRIAVGGGGHRTSPLVPHRCRRAAESSRLASFLSTPGRH